MVNSFVVTDNNSTERPSDLELTCLKMTAEGSLPSEIGLALGLAEDRVLFHLVSVEAKLSASNRLHAVVIAMRLELF